MDAIIDALFGLPSKIAVIIGQTPIAQATAQVLQAAGATVVSFATEADAPRPHVALDDPDSVAAAIEGVVAEHGAIDILVYAATRTGAYPFADMTLDQWDALQTVNLRGAFMAMQAVVPHMRRAGGGRIVAVSTMGALHPVLNGNAGYGAAKAGLNALVRSVALDHAADNILANVVSPGAVPVGAPPADARPSDGPAFQPGRMLLGMGTAQDVAAAILYLASPASRFMTGQNLVLDGGFLIA